MPLPARPGRRLSWVLLATMLATLVTGCGSLGPGAPVTAHDSVDAPGAKLAPGIRSSWTIRPLAGQPASYPGCSFRDGASGTSCLDFPGPAAPGPNGTLYFADADLVTGSQPPSCRLRVLDLATGQVTTRPTNGVTTPAQAGSSAPRDSLVDCSGLAVGSTGTVYVAEATSGRVLAVDPGGHASTLAGGGVGEARRGEDATAVSLHRPSGLAVIASGMLFVADSGTGAVVEIDLRSRTVADVVPIAGGTCGSGADWLVADAAGGSVWVTSRTSPCIFHLAVPTGSVSSVHAAVTQDGLGPIAVLDDRHVLTVVHDRIVAVRTDDGSITELAGTGRTPVSQEEITALSRDQAASDAPLANPQALAVVGARTIILTEGQDHVIRALVPR
jgi:hypothetical protein